jgi:hypothetical protein
MPETELLAKLKTALPIFQANVGADDDTLIAALEAAGIERPLATRMAQFLPLAFTRVFFQRSKVTFADTYVRSQADGKRGPEQRLDDEPVYREGVKLARQQVGGAAAMLTVAGRSTAYHALHQAMREGVRLEDLAVAPAVMMSDEPRPPRSWWPWGK